MLVIPQIQLLPRALFEFLDRGVCRCQSQESDPARHDTSVLIRNIISLAIKIERMSSGNYKMESQEEKFFLRPVLLLGSVLICLAIRLIFKIKLHTICQPLGSVRAEIFQGSCPNYFIRQYPKCATLQNVNCPPCPQSRYIAQQLCHRWMRFQSEMALLQFVRETGNFNVLFQVCQNNSGGTWLTPIGIVTKLFMLQWPKWQFANDSALPLFHLYSLARLVIFCHSPSSLNNRMSNGLY